MRTGLLVFLIASATGCAHRVTTAAAAAPKPHLVKLNWAASPSVGVKGYQVYRGTQSGGPYTKLTVKPVPKTSWVDRAVVAGGRYFYVATTVDLEGNESAFSKEAAAVIPGK